MCPRGYRSDVLNFREIFQASFIGRAFTISIFHRRLSSNVHGVVHSVSSIVRGGHKTGIGIDIRIGHEQDVRRRVRRAGRLLIVPSGQAGGALGDPAFRYCARVDSS